MRALSFLFPLLASLLAAAPLQADRPIPELPASLSAPAGAPTVRSALVGVWRLVRYADTPDGGEPIYAFGKEPVGQFMFTANGRISINIMRNPPNAQQGSADIDPDACQPAWYCSYFGTYRVTPDGGHWITHVLGGNIPSYLGTDQSRAFRIDGAKLIVFETYKADSKTVRAERVLERVR